MKMKCTRMNGPAECEGEFAAEIYGYKFYFVKSDGRVYLIEYSTGCAILETKEHRYRKELLSKLGEMTAEYIIKRVESRISYFTSNNINYPVNK